MTEPLDLDAIESRLTRGGFSFHNAHLKIEALVAAVRERDAEIAELQEERDQAVHSLDVRHTRFVELEAEIARLREVFDRTCKQHAEAMRGTCNTYQAEIARLSEVERRHLGWCDACLVYHRTGNCPVTGEPPSKEAREGWSLPTPQAAPPGADVMEPLGKEFEKVLHDNLPNLYVRSDQGGAPPCADVDALASAIFQGEITDWPARAARALQQYGDERAAAAAAQANSIYELHNRLVGHIEMDPESRAEWVMKQSLDGLHIGENNRGSIKDYLAGHFLQAMVDAAAAARTEWPPNTVEPTDPATGTPLDNEPALWLRNHWVYTQDSALDAIAAAREAAIEEVVKHTSEQIAILGGVLLRNPCRDEILRTLSALNKDFRALAAKPHVAS